MKSSTVLFVAVATAPTYAAGNDPFEQWVGPKAGDVRGPCPFLNAFTNHGFLPRSGKYITEEDLASALFDAVNIDEGLSKMLFDFAITTNPEPNSTWFSLDHLARHNVLEHDASLSRIDAYFGHAEVFNQEVFDETRSYWGDVIDVKSGVDSIMGRLNTSNETNPEFSLSQLGEGFLLGETAAYIGILGDAEALTVNKTFVEYLFQNERLPTELGWKRPETASSEEALMESLDKVSKEYEARLNATSHAKRDGRYKRSMGHGGIMLR